MQKQKIFCCCHSQHRLLTLKKNISIKFHASQSISDICQDQRNTDAQAPKALISALNSNLFTSQHIERQVLLLRPISSGVLLKLLNQLSFPGTQNHAFFSDCIFFSIQHGFFLTHMQPRVASTDIWKNLALCN